MADEKTGKPAEAEKPAAKEDKPKKKGGKAVLILFMIGFGISFQFIFPTLVLVMLGMFPTLVSLFTDSDRNKSGTAAVGAMNAAGVTPFVIDLWVKGQSMENVSQILRDPSNWLIMLGAAAIGQMIVFAVPQAVASLSLARSESRLKVLRANLDSLRESWGPDVGSTKPVDKVIRSE